METIHHFQENLNIVSHVLIQVLSRRSFPAIRGIVPRMSPGGAAEWTFPIAFFVRIVPKYQLFPLQKKTRVV